MKSAFWRSMAVFALIAVPMMASANDATIGSEVAHNAMSGSTLMNTTAVFNVFPHYTIGQGNGFEASLADFDENGYGRFWWDYGQDWTVNMTVGRGDYGLGGTNFMWGGNNLMMANSDVFSDYGSQFSDSGWLNLGVARPLANGAAWSANFLYASGENNNDTNGSEDTEDGFGFSFSYGNGAGLDFQAEFVNQTSTFDADTSNEDLVEGEFMGFGVNARYDNGGRWIYQANVSYGKGTDTVTDGAGDATETEDKDLNFLLNVGTKVRDAADGQATLEFFFGRMANENGDTEVTDMHVPGVRFAAWQAVTERFGLMASTEWVYGMNDTTAGIDGDTTYNGADFGYAFGAYMQASANVRFDAQLREDNMDKFFSLGNDSPMIAYFGATVGLN